MWHALGANLDERPAAQIASRFEPMEQILESIDNDCDLTDACGYRSAGDPKRTVELLNKDLMEIHSFNKQPGRLRHPSYPKMSSNLLKNLDYRDLQQFDERAP